MAQSVFRFTGTDQGMSVVNSYDVGWIEHLDCSGVGGWSDVVNFNEDGAAVFRIRNIKTGAAMSICGQRYNGTWVFSVLTLSEHNTGLTADWDDQSVTVTCEDGFTVEYDSTVDTGV